MNNDKAGADLSVTTFQTVVIPKDKLLATLVANREKHDSIYSAAVQGYWIEANKVLDNKKIEFDEAVSKAGHQFNQYRDRLGADFTHQITGMRHHVDEQNKDRVGSSFSLTSSLNVNLNFNASWPLKYPESHLEDYNRAIDLLNFSVADKVELSVSDFDAYVRNNWSWRQSFLGTNATYANSYALLSGCSGMLIGNTSVAASGGIMAYSGFSTVITGSSAYSMTNQLNRIF